MSVWVDNTRCSYFNSLDDFWGEIKSNAPSGELSVKESAKLMDGSHYDSSFGGETTTANMPAEQLKDWLKCGWQEGYERAQKSLKQVIIPPVQTIKRRGVWSNSGDDLSQDRLFAGQTDTCWRTTRKAQGIGPPRIRILVSVGANADLEGNKLFWRAAAAMPLADALVMSGYHVAIDAIQHSQSTYKGSKNTVLCVRLKEYTQPLNPAYITGVLGYAGFFRRLIFLWFHHGGSDLVAYGSLGSSRSYTQAGEKVREWVRNGEDSLSLFVPNGVDSEKDANEWVKNAVETIEGKRPNTTLTED